MKLDLWDATMWRVSVAEALYRTAQRYRIHGNIYERLGDRSQHSDATGVPYFSSNTSLVGAGAPQT